MCELVVQRWHHVDHQRMHGIETRNARRVHAQKWCSQVAWLVSEANTYTDLTLSSTSTKLTLVKLYIKCKIQCSRV